MTSPFQLAAARNQQRAPVLPVPVRVRPRGGSGQPSAAFLSGVQRSQAQRQERKGILGQVKDVVGDIIPGFAHLAKTAATEAAAPVRLAVDAIQGDAKASDIPSLLNPADVAVDTFMGRRNERQASLHPLADQFGSSMRTTYEDVIHPSRFKKAWDEGQIVNKVLEDAGNIALVGGVAAKGLGAAARTAEAAGNAERAAMLGRAGDVAQRIATPLDKVADAPVSVPRAVIQGGRKALIKGFDSAAEGAFGAGAQTRAISLAAKYPGVLTDEGRFLLGASRKAERDARRAQTKTTRVLHQAAEVADVSLDEQGAVTAVRTGIAQQIDNLVRQGVDPEQARQTVVLRDRPEQTLSAGANEIALGYLNRTLPPEVLDRMDRYAGVVDEVIGAQTERALAGQGRPGGPLDPRQLGEDPLWDRVDQALKDAGGKGVDVDTGALLDPADQGLLNDILDSPEVYPAPWRPAMRAAGLAREANAVPADQPFMSDMEATWRDDAARRAEIDAFDALPDDTQILVFHGTTAENAARIADTGKVSRSPRGDDISAGAQSDGLYVAPTALDAQNYAGPGGKVVALHVRKGDLAPSPEARSAPSVGYALYHSFDGAVIPAGTKLAVREILDADSIPRTGTASPRQTYGAPMLTIPVRPSEMNAAGMQQPRYLPGGRSDLVDPTAVGTGRTPIREGIRGLQGVSSEKLRAASEFQPFSARTIAEKAGQEARTTVMNERVVEMFNDPTVRTVADAIPETRRAELRTAAEREARAQRGTPAQIKVRTDELYGKYLHDELRDVYRHDVIMGDRNNPQVGDFDPADKAAYAKITDDSVVLPAGLKDRLIPYMRGKEMGRTFNMLAKINAKFKGLVLPWSVRWQLGDAVGGAFMAWSGGGVNPAKLFGAMRDLRKLDDAGVRAIFDDLQDSGLNIEEAAWMRGDSMLGTPTTKAGKAWRRAGDVRRASFRLNETINRLNRQGYALAKLQDLLTEKGLNLDDVQADGRRMPVTRYSPEPLDASVARPGGAYFNYSPENDMYSKRRTRHDRYAAARNPLVVDRETWAHSTGEAAVKALSTPEQFRAFSDRVLAGDVVGAIDYAERELGVILPEETRAFLTESGWGFGVFDSVGGQMARNAGHDAITGRVRPGGSGTRGDGYYDEYVALEPSALSEQPSAWGDPEVQAAINEAVDDANKVMGTFDEMTPFERNYVRNVFPFWVWNRHITALAWRTAIDNPSRAMWTMNLGRYGAQQNGDAELLPWQEGSLIMGNTLIPTNFINPFNDVAGGSIYTPTGAVRSMSPALKLGFAAVGKDANRGFADITRSYDGGGLDELGRAGGFRLLSPAELAYQAVRQLPQGRSFLNVLPTGEVANVGLGPHPRYGTGEFMVDKAGRPIDTDSRWQSLYGLLGMGGTGEYPLLGSLSDNADIIAARDRRRAEAARRAANAIHFKG